MAVPLFDHCGPKLLCASKGLAQIPNTVAPYLTASNYKTIFERRHQRSTQPHHSCMLDEIYNIKKKNCTKTRTVQNTRMDDLAFRNFRSPSKFRCQNACFIER